MIDKSIDITNLITDQTGVNVRIFRHLSGNYSDADFFFSREDKKHKNQKRADLLGHVTFPDILPLKSSRI